MDVDFADDENNNKESVLIYFHVKIPTFLITERNLSRVICKLFQQ